MASDLPVLLGLLRGMPQHGSHEQRLERFYAGQAQHYDRFRARLLGGRQELIEQLSLGAGSHVIELGAGTGANLEFFPAARRADCSFTLVDLCEPLLAKAAVRFAEARNVQIQHADAAQFETTRLADVVLLSYTLSMMPNWRGVLSNCVRLLRPGGRIAVVDFHVLDATSSSLTSQRHGWWTRTFWPRWFRHDGVELGPQRLQTLAGMFPQHDLVLCSHAMPWMGGLRAPYYQFIGQRQA
jgi:ubiquinone/menaquinone biosynthesis C-methylase UbiE